MQFSSIQPKDRAVSGATILGQSGPGSNGNERMLRIPQNSNITGTSPSDCLVSYLFGWGGLTPLQSVYSTAPADWAKVFGKNIYDIFFYALKAFEYLIWEI